MLAGGWEARLGSGQQLPQAFIVIDKSVQQLYYYKKHSPAKLISRYPCTTGQVIGDKFLEGDLRTPEGIYFLEHRLTGPLDHELYGNIAFALNFPNPVDRLRGKQGSGIWLHGRGHEIIPRETKGCIAMNTRDLEVLGKEIAYGLTPVAVTERLIDTAPQAEVDKDLAELEKQVNGWAKAWEAKSEGFFQYYLAKEYSQAMGQSFSGFTNHKKRLFAQYPWIDVLISDVRILPGPGYWVSYFGQYYRTPSFASQGIKRLYWQRDSSGAMKILGEEWQRADLGLDDMYAKRTEESVRALLALWREAWLTGDAKRYSSFYHGNASQGDRRGAENIAAQKAELWRVSKPSFLSFDKINVSLHPRGAVVSLIQEYRASDGYADKGIKTLILERQNNSWLIVDEQWRQGS